MVTGTRQGKIRPIQGQLKKHVDGSSSTPIQVDEPTIEPMIQDPPPPIITLIEEDDERDESNLQMVLYEGEKESSAVETSVPNQTDGETEAAFTTPPVVIDEGELNEIETDIPEPGLPVPPSDPKSSGTDSQDTEDLDVLKPGQPFRGSEKDDPLPEETPEIHSSVIKQTRYAVSDEEQSDDDAVLVTRKRKVLKKAGLPPLKKLKKKTPAPSTSPISKAADSHLSSVKKEPTRSSSRTKTKAKQTEAPKPKKKSSVNRFASFQSRGIIDEKIVDMQAEAHWGYPEIIIKGKFQPTVVGLGSYVRSVIVDFYSALPESEDESVKVFIRDQEYVFSPAVVNEFLGMETLSEAEMKKEADADSVSLKTLAQLFTADEKAEWSDISTIVMTPCFAALVVIASHNWIPSTHRNHVSIERAKLIYKLSAGIRVDFGQLVFDQVMSMTRLQVKDSRWLLFPRLIYGIIQMQDPLSLGDDDVLVRPLYYRKDKRSGVAFIKREEAKKTAQTQKPQPPTKATTASTSAAATPSPATGYVSVDLGTVRFPTPPLQPAAAILALNDIVYMLQTFTETVQGLIVNLRS
uniref:Putative plant transposon protein domain-containing protein n=1 Tax=Noccaea caerulescens TaxID=107243 RepID=A0A1J3GP32_NOCCA